MAEPAWLTSKADQRLALLAEHVDAELTRGAGVLMTSLTDPPADTPIARARWERTCDNCGTVCTTAPFYTGHVGRVLHSLQVIITYGVCKPCAKTVNEDT